MKVVFLCGGIGERMFPLTEDKFLFNFVGKTLLEHQIERAKQVGLTEFVIIGSPQNIPKLEGVIRNIPGIKVQLAVQGEPRGIANALISAKHLLNDNILMVNPNDVFESSAYTQLIETSRNSSAISYLVGYEVRNYFPGGYLVVDERNELKFIVEKPGKGNEPSNLVNILVHLHTNPKTLLKYAEGIQNTRDDGYECALDAIVKDGYSIKVIPYAGFWAPIKYPWHVFPVVKHFLDQSEKYISPSANISEKAILDGKIIIRDNVRVLEGAVIKGPVYIGPNSIIGNNSLIRDYSHIGADCVVGHSTEVKGSYIGDRCWFHMNYIGDSIIGEGCSFGAGTILANFRFDEANISVKVNGESVDTGLDKLGAIIGNNSQTGVNVSVMPGIKIGPNSIVGSHVCLIEDLEPGKIILAETRYKIVENNVQLSSEKRAKIKRKLGEL